MATVGVGQGGSGINYASFPEQVKIRGGWDQ